MPNLGERGPQINTDFEKKVGTFYLEIINNFKNYGFDVTPSEAVFLKQITRDVLRGNDEAMEVFKKTGNSLDFMFTYKEIIERFFVQYYGVSYVSYIDSVESLNVEEKKKARRDFFEHIKNLRKDRELI